jgi:hypothetical protein
MHIQLSYHVYPIQPGNGFLWCLGLEWFEHHQDAYRLYPAGLEGHWRTNEYHFDGWAPA